MTETAAGGLAKPATQPRFATETAPAGLAELAKQHPVMIEAVLLANVHQPPQTVPAGLAKTVPGGLVRPTIPLTDFEHQAMRAGGTASGNAIRASSVKSVGGKTEQAQRDALRPTSAENLATFEVRLAG